MKVNKDKTTTILFAKKPKMDKIRKISIGNMTVKLGKISQILKNIIWQQAKI